MPSLPERLKVGDKVRFLSPASTPDRDGIMVRKAILESWGLRVDFGTHAFDQVGYLAGTDEQRLSDFNAALHDPDVRAIVATRGGKGSYRIADRIDFGALMRDPKIIVGFSDITAIELSIYHHCGAASIHGNLFGGAKEVIAEQTRLSLKSCLMSDNETVVKARETEPTAKLTTDGQATGPVIGGNLQMISTLAGWGLPSFAGAILLLEDVEKFPGQIDRMLVQLIKSGIFDGLAGIAIGQFAYCRDTGAMNVIDVLRDHLAPLGIPILGGLPLGHGDAPVAVPHGTMARLDADSGILAVTPAVR